jgi:thiazole tautomerase (transcriptional regulator TenI)
VTRRETTVPRIHAITTDEILAAPDFLARARAVMEALGTRGAVHLRARSLSGKMFYRIAEELSSTQRATESWLVINDRLDVALAARARAVQLTSQSIGIEDAKAIGNGICVGASVHNVGEAIAAHNSGAAWLVAGHVYQTASHAMQVAKGENFIADLVWRVSTPVIAIGGILPENVKALRGAGAYGIAAIRGIWGADDAASAASDYLSEYDSDGDS